MSWNDGKVIVLRASNFNDPTISYVEVRLAVTWCTPTSPGDGDVTEYWDGERVRGQGAYWNVAVKCKGFKTRASLIDADLQDFGVYLYLEYLLTAFPYKWLYATYEVGSDPLAGPIRRAGQHTSASSGEDDVWSITVPLPLRIELKGELQAEDDEEIGGAACSFVLESSFPRSW
jgi:hypothetical protein